MTLLQIAVQLFCSAGENENVSVDACFKLANQFIEEDKKYSLNTVNDVHINSITIDDFRNAFRDDIYFKKSMRKSREVSVVISRNSFMYLLRKQGMNLKIIGEIFNMHHSTALHGIKAVDYELSHGRITAEKNEYNFIINYLTSTYDIFRH